MLLMLSMNISRVSKINEKERENRGRMQIFLRRSSKEVEYQFNPIQVAGASFRGPLLICLLILTLTVKSASHTLQFTLKDYVLLN